MKTMDIRNAEDADLVAESLAGKREAFGLIVERYQSLICSLAYSATGGLNESEDLAQETFVTAWKELSSLREPAKLRPWLCQIARNLLYHSRRHQQREPAFAAEQLEALAQSRSSEPSPRDHAITREEEVILWQSVEQIPETYREPLVLFYRERQSIQAVAGKLDLSEDAVKQRLARGRKMLHEQVLQFVEGALERTNPGKAFTLGVLAALPFYATSARAAGIGAMAAKGTATAKAASVLGWVGMILGPVIGILGAWLGTKLNIESTTSPRERRFMVRVASVTWAYILAFDLLIGILIFWSSRSHSSSAVSWVIAFGTACLGFVIGLAAWFVWVNRHQRRIRTEHAVSSGADLSPCASLDYFEYRSKHSLFGLPLVHITSGRRADGRVNAAKGWIAIGGLAYGILFSCGGIAVGGISCGGIAVGVFSFGGLGLGLGAFAGLAVGIWAVGGAAAIGIASISGAIAIAWSGATGTAAIAHHFAQGNALALAQHANDAVAKSFFATHRFFAHPNTLFALMGFCWLPMLFILWQTGRIMKVLRARKGSLH